MARFGAHKTIWILLQKRMETKCYQARLSKGNILAADHLVLVVFPSQCHQRRLNNATAKPQNQMQG